LSFWENYYRGPRPLTDAEGREVRDLENEISRLEGTSGESTDFLLFGKRVVSPMGVASGPAPNFKWLDFFARLGYGILTYKTMRDRRWQGHGMPNLLHVRGDFERGFVASEEVTGSITNSLGMPTPEPEVWKREARQMAAVKGDRFFVMSATATVEGGTEEDLLSQFAALALEGKLAGADSVELNLSCPNVLPGEGGETFTNAKLSGRVVDSVRKSVGSGYPVFVKVGYLDDYGGLVEETYDDRVAYVAVNSVPAVVRSSTGEVLFTDRGGRAGICGAAIRERARMAVSNLAGLSKNGRELEIIGLGGVLAPGDATALMEAGACAVESATGALLDPCLGLKARLAILEAKSGGAGGR